MDLEGIVSRLSDKFKVSSKYRQVGLEFLTDRLGWLARHKEVYPKLKEDVVEDELQYFYRMRGAIPIITAKGPKRILAASDLYLLRPFEIGVVNPERRYDQELFRLDRRTAERSRKGNGPSRGELTDQLGQTQQLRSYFHRPVSYDDVLPVREVMWRYQTGQRSVTIQIGSQSMQMTPETLEDFWIMNPLFIKLRINGKLVNERLYYFWRRVESDGKSSRRDSGNDGSEPPWPALINREGRRGDTINYSGTAVTWEAVASNPKAKFIRHGPLPSRELVRLGVLDVSTERKRRGSGKSSASATLRGRGNVPEGEYRSPNAEPAQAPPVISSYEELNRQLNQQFGGYVPADQIAGVVFGAKINGLLRERPVSEHEALELARTLGVRSSKGVTIETAVKKIIAKIPRLDTIKILPKPTGEIESGEEIENAPVYYALTGTEPVRQVLYSALVQAIQEIHPNPSLRTAHQASGGLIHVLEKSGVKNRGDLEELLQNGWGAIQAVEGLVNKEPGKRYRLAYLLRACQIKEYEVPPEAVAASPLKYLGKDSQPIKDVFRDPLREAIKKIHPEWSETSIHQAAGGVITTFESNGILFMRQLEELLEEGWGAIQAVKGLVNKEQGKSDRLTYFLLTCKDLGYKVPDEAVNETPLKYMGKDSKPLREAFHPTLKQVIMDANPTWHVRDASREATKVLSVLEANGIVFESDLEKLVQKGPIGIQAVNGLVSADSSRRARLGYFMSALERGGYMQPASQAAAAPAQAVLS